MLPDGTRYHRRMASISRSDVEHVAHLAQLYLTDDELDLFTRQLGDILMPPQDIDLQLPLCISNQA